MDINLRAIEYIREGAEMVETASGETITAAQMMERFLFDRYAQWVRISEMSGGERRRLYLLRILMAAPNVLLLDEPTNDLDIDTLKVLENYLDGFKGSVLTVSHDRYFLDRVCDTIYGFEAQGDHRSNRELHGLCGQAHRVSKIRGPHSPQKIKTQGSTHRQTPTSNL